MAKRSQAKVSDHKTGTMTVLSGQKVDLTKFSSQSVCLQDIAEALSKIARFNGHTNSIFSVAEHCVMGWLWCEKNGVENGVEDKYAIEALLHDAGEAYTGDIILPMKQCFPELVAFEDKIAGTIMNVLWPDNDVVRPNGQYYKSPYMALLDKKMAQWESAFFRPQLEVWYKYREEYQLWEDIYTNEVRPLTHPHTGLYDAGQAKALFLECCRQSGLRDNNLQETIT